MKIIANEKLIKRNNKIGQFASIGSLVVLGVGMYFSFKDATGTYMTLTFTALILGFILFQFGNYYLNRWGKSPRPDELISQALKGLDDRYSLYHYSTNIPHLLVGPAGIFALLPFGQAGTLFYDKAKNRWRQHGGSFFMKAFANEGLGKPDSEAGYTKEQLEKYFQKIGLKENKVDITPVLVFTNTKSTVEGEGSPVAFTTGEKLKDYIRRQAKEHNYETDKINELLDENKKLK